MLQEDAGKIGHRPATGWFSWMVSLPRQHCYRSGLFGRSAARVEAGALVGRRAASTRRVSSVIALIRLLPGEIEKAETRNQTPAARTAKEPAAEEAKGEDQQREESLPVSLSEILNQTLPSEILRAQKVMVLLRLHSVMGAHGEENIWHPD
jgi:hypothetical protein